MKKKTVVLRFSLLASAITLAGVIGGCGGGGGGGGAAPVQEVSPTTTAPFTPVAGILRHAIVKAYCGNSVTELAVDTTRNEADIAAKGGKVGQAVLTWRTADCVATPVRFEVKAGLDTTMEDEVDYLTTGAVNQHPVQKDTDLKLGRWVIDPTKIPITGITSTAVDHLAAALASSKLGAMKDVTEQQLDGAKRSVVQSVCGNPNETNIEATKAARQVCQDSFLLEVVPVSLMALDASVEDQNKYYGGAPSSGAKRLTAALATTISALSKTQSNATVPEKYQAAVQALEASVIGATKYQTEQFVPNTESAEPTPAKKISDAWTTIKASADWTTIATTLSQDPLIESSTTKVELAVASEVESRSTGGSEPVVVPPATAATAHDLFVSLHGDAAAMTGSTGFLSTRLDAINADWNANGIGNGRGFINIFQALSRATDMAYQAKSATWTAPGASPNTVYAVPGESNVSVLTDSTGAPLAYIRTFYDSDLNNAQNFMYCKVMADAKALGKAGCYYDLANFDITAPSLSGAYHAVEVHETASSHYTWQDFTDLTVAAKQSGEAVITRDTSGLVTAATFGTANGNSIQPLAAGAHHSTLDIAATVTSAATTQTFAISGVVKNVDQAGTSILSSISLQGAPAPGSQLVLATGATSHTASANLIAQIKTQQFQYDGTLAMTDFTASKNGEYSPGTSVFAGKVSTLDSNGTPTTFLQGSIEANITNLADYDPRLPVSATNFIKESDSFSGTVTVGVGAAAKSYIVSYTIDGLTYGQQAVQLNYTNPSAQQISVTGKSYADRSIPPTLTVTSGGIVFSLTNGVGDIMAGSTKVGTVTKSGVTFTNGTTIVFM